jgi:hypothetical protein
MEHVVITVSVGRVKVNVHFSQEARQDATLAVLQRMVRRDLTLVHLEELLSKQDFALGGVVVPMILDVANVGRVQKPIQCARLDSTHVCLFPDFGPGRDTKIVSEHMRKSPIEQLQEGGGFGFVFGQNADNHSAGECL